MIAVLKCLKIMQFQRNIFHFNGLKLPYKMMSKQCKRKTKLLILDSIVTSLLIHLLLIPI